MVALLSHICEDSFPTMIAFFLTLTYERLVAEPAWRNTLLLCLFDKSKGVIVIALCQAQDNHALECNDSWLQSKLVEILEQLYAHFVVGSVDAAAQQAIERFEVGRNVLWLVTRTATLGIGKRVVRRNGSVELERSLKVAEPNS